MSRSILILLGHPDRDSLCGALAHSYATAAGVAGHRVRLIALGELDFDPVLHHGYHQVQPLEPGLEDAAEAIRACDHLVLVYPTWWGGMPALLKGFFDRVLLPGFAFRYRRDSPWWDRLLAGRSARVITPLDTPPWYYRWIYRDPPGAGQPAGRGAQQHPGTARTVAGAGVRTRVTRRLSGASADSAALPHRRCPGRARPDPSPPARDSVLPRWIRPAAAAATTTVIAAGRRRRQPAPQRLQPRRALRLHQPQHQCPAQPAHGTGELLLQHHPRAGQHGQGDDGVLQQQAPVHQPAPSATATW